MLDGEDLVEYFCYVEQVVFFVWVVIEQVGVNLCEFWLDELQLFLYGLDSYVGEFLCCMVGVKGWLLLELNLLEFGCDMLDYVVEDFGLDYMLLCVLCCYEVYWIESGCGYVNFCMLLDVIYDFVCLLLFVEDEGEDWIDLQLFLLGCW